MKNIAKVFLLVIAFAALASCSSHEKCPTYSGEIETEKPTNV
jgi:hypothetical protein